MKSIVCRIQSVTNNFVWGHFNQTYGGDHFEKYRNTESPVSSVHGILKARIVTRVGSHSLLQGIFLNQGSNPHCRQILYSLSHQGSPRVITKLTVKSKCYIMLQQLTSTIHISKLCQQAEITTGRGLPIHFCLEISYALVIGET